MPIGICPGRSRASATGGRYVQPDAVNVRVGRTGHLPRLCRVGQNYPHDAASDWQANRQRTLATIRAAITAAIKDVG